MIDLAHFSKAERVGATSATLRWTARLTVDTTLLPLWRKSSGMNRHVERDVDSEEKRSVLSRLRHTVGDRVDDLKFAGQSKAETTTRS